MTTGEYVIAIILLACFAVAVLILNELRHPKK